MIEEIAILEQTIRLLQAIQEKGDICEEDFNRICPEYKAVVYERISTRKDIFSVYIPKYYMYAKSQTGLQAYIADLQIELSRLNQEREDKDQQRRIAELEENELRYKANVRKWKATSAILGVILTIMTIMDYVIPFVSARFSTNPPRHPAALCADSLRTAADPEENRQKGESRHPTKDTCCASQAHTLQNSADSTQR